MLRHGAKGWVSSRRGRIDLVDASDFCLTRRWPVCHWNGMMTVVVDPCRTSEVEIHPRSDRIVRRVPITQTKLCHTIPNSRVIIPHPLRRAHDMSSSA